MWPMHGQLKIVSTFHYVALPRIRAETILSSNRLLT